MLSLFVLNLCHQVNQSEISFEIREEDVGANGQKRRSDEGLMSSKEKIMRVEPEPMAAVFFDVEPEEVDEMASTLKVMIPSDRNLDCPSVLLLKEYFPYHAC